MQAILYLNDREINPGRLLPQLLSARVARPEQTLARFHLARI